MRLPCSFVPSAGPVDASCLPPGHPGARMANGCTLNGVVTDGADLYVGTARHCVGALGEPLRVTGVGSPVGALAPNGQPTLVVGVTLRTEMKELAKHLGTPVTLVTGAPMAST